MAGPLKTLFGALQASTFMTGVSVIFGDEETFTQRFKLPLVVMVPRGGPFTSPGYAQATDPETELLWETAETVEFWLWSASTNPAAQGAVDHADAIEALRQLVLSALQDQRAQYTDAGTPTYGVAYSAVAGRWEVSTNPSSRFGRAYVLSVRVAVSIPMAAPTSTEATITTIQQSDTI